MGQFNLQEVAALLEDAGTAINERISNDNTLTTDQVEILSEQAIAIFDKANEMLALATIEIGNEGKDALIALKNARTEIDNAIRTIGIVQKVIDGVAKLIALAGAITSGNIGAIAQAVSDVLSVLK